MDNTVLKKYEISFVNTIFTYQTGEKEIHKMPGTTIEALSGFLLD